MSEESIKESNRRFAANYSRVDKEMPGFKTGVGDAGYDMYATKDTWIFPMFPKKVELNFKAEIPESDFGLVTSRSGMSLKGNVVIPGIVDSNYRGQISAIMFRVGFLPRKLKAGTRVAQMLVVPHSKLAWVERDKLSESNRGKNGFGHSGLK